MKESNPPLKQKTLIINNKKIINQCGRFYVAHTYYRHVPSLDGTLHTVLLQNSNKSRLYKFSIDTLLLYMYVYCFDVCKLFLNS